MLVVVTLLLVVAWPVGADRYVCQWGDLPPTYVPDANEMSISFDGAGGGLITPTAQTLSLMPAVVPGPVITITVPADLNVLAARVVTATPPANQTDLPTTLTDLLAPSAGPPTPEFLASLQRIYSATAQPETDAIWDRYQREDASLAVDQRVGNAVVKYVVELNRPPNGDSTARPDLLKPNATRGTVRATNGVGVRAKPWGPSGGPALPPGASVEIIPPAEGPWYQIRTAGGTGWVAGLWLDMQ